MPRVIFKCTYIKPGGENAPHRSNLVRYMATRSGVCKLRDDLRYLPTTKKQQEIIAKILREFPSVKNSFEYEDYIANPTRENASELITQALEQNMDAVAKKQDYLDYIAHRPGVEKQGTHGLFSDAGVEVVVSAVATEVAEHQGNVWTPIISLRREDAARLGYDNGERWRSLLRSYCTNMADGLKIPYKDFNWYAAFHDESHHPHIHMVCYSTDTSKGFLTKQGIDDIKSGLAGRIFRADLEQIYADQTEYRDLLNAEGKRVMQELCSAIRNSSCQNEFVVEKLLILSDKLSRTSGKKVYGYLKADVKQLVNEITDELATDDNVERLYELWWQRRLEVLRTYSDKLPARPPLSSLEEFKVFRNHVVREAANLSSQFPPAEDAPMQEIVPATIDEAVQEPPSDDIEVDMPPNHRYSGNSKGYRRLPNLASTDESAYIDWTSDYKQAKRHWYADPPDYLAAHELLDHEAGCGNALAMHDLGRMYADGLGVEVDEELSAAHYASALAAFLSIEDNKPDAYTEYRIGKLYHAGLGTEQDDEKAAHWFIPSARAGNKYAQYSLGCLYYHGTGVEQSYTEARQLFERSASKDFPYASYELGKLHREGKGTIKDCIAADRCFEKAFVGFCTLEADSHDDKLQYRLGIMLMDGVGVEPDRDCALVYLGKAARKGNQQAQYRLAVDCLQDPTAQPEQVREAIGWLTDYAESGNMLAQYAIGKLYRDGQHVDADEDKAVYWLTLAAEQDNQHAQYALGKLLLAPTMVKQDIAVGIAWLERSVQQENSFAQYMLGNLYLKGEVVERDGLRAVSYLRRSAGQDNQYAQYRLGKLFFTGEVVERSVGFSEYNFLAAARQGNQFAQYALGKQYLLGTDLPQDKEKALHYLGQAVEQGNEYAQFYLDNVDDLMTHSSPSALAAATQLLHHLGGIFEERAFPAAHQQLGQSDSKRRKKLRELKASQGHAADDHEVSMKGA